MSVRKLKRSYSSSISGYKFSEKCDDMITFESTLERDYIYTLEFDLNVKWYEAQPVTIEYFDDEGKLRRYTPDFLVKYYNDSEVGKYLKNTLVEVKPRENLWKNWKELKPKFKAAIDYAHSKGMKFKILTEKEIRTEYLENAKFLLRYRNIPYDTGLMECLIDTINELKVSNPQEIIKVASIDNNRRAELLHALWCLIDNKVIGCDVQNKITMNSEIWAIEELEPTFIKP